MGIAETVKFTSKKLYDRDGKEVINKQKDVVYERNDIAVLEEILQQIDSNKVAKKKWNYILSIEDKVREKHRLGLFNCEIEFSVKEIEFLSELIDNIEMKLRDGLDGKRISFTLYHLRTWRALNQQLNSKKEDV